MELFPREQGWFQYGKEGDNGKDVVPARAGVVFNYQHACAEETKDLAV